MKRIESGFVKIPRAWWSHLESAPPAWVKVWLHVAMNANIRPGSVNGFPVQAGQLVFSWATLAQRCGVSVQQTRDAIDKMLRTGSGTISRTGKLSVLTVIDSCTYDRSLDHKEQGREQGREHSENKVGNDLRTGSGTGSRTGSGTGSAIEELDSFSTIYDVFMDDKEQGREQGQEQDQERNENKVENRYRRIEEQRNITPLSPFAAANGDVPEIPIEGHDRLFAIEDIKSKPASKSSVQKNSSDGLTPAQRQWFDEFWENVWAKTAVGAAKKAYGKKVRDEQTAANVLAAVKKHAEFLRANRERQYWPHPSTWLNGERWLDELPAANTTAPVAPQSYLPEYPAPERRGHDPKAYEIDFWKEGGWE